jgi:hypothetical protein
MLTVESVTFLFGSLVFSVFPLLTWQKSRDSMQHIRKIVFGIADCMLDTSHILTAGLDSDKLKTLGDLVLSHSERKKCEAAQVPYVTTSFISGPWTPCCFHVCRRRHWWRLHVKPSNHACKPPTSWTPVGDRMDHTFLFSMDRWHYQATDLWRSIAGFLQDITCRVYEAIYGASVPCQ